MLNNTTARGKCTPHASREEFAAGERLLARAGDKITNSPRDDHTTIAAKPTVAARKGSKARIAALLALALRLLGGIGYGVFQIVINGL